MNIQVIERYHVAADKFLPGDSLQIKEMFSRRNTVTLANHLVQSLLGGRKFPKPLILHHQDFAMEK